MFDTISELPDISMQRGTKIEQKGPKDDYSAAFSVGILRTLVIKSYGSLRHVSNKTCFAGLALDKRKSSQRKQSRKNVSLLENEI